MSDGELKNNYSPVVIFIFTAVVRLQATKESVRVCESAFECEWR